MAPSRKPRTRRTGKAPEKRSRPSRPPPPPADPFADKLVSVIVGRGGMTLQAHEVRVADAAAMGRALEAALSAAQATTPGLRDTVDTVHGGSIPYVDDGDWGDGRRRVGFVR